MEEIMFKMSIAKITNVNHVLMMNQEEAEMPVSIIKQSWNLWKYSDNLYLENKGIVFKARWFVRLDITQAQPLLKWNDEGI